jgi:hypothetical protein
LEKILKTLVNAHLNVVVIDKYFGSNTCAPDDPGTVNLMVGIQKLCESHASVVVGRKVNHDARLGPGSRANYPLDPAVSLAPLGCVSEGVLNMDVDLRRIALWWPAVESVAGRDGPPPSLALASGLTAPPGLLGVGRLTGWTPWMSPPYVNFLEKDNFRLVTSPLATWSVNQNPDLAGRPVATVRWGPHCAKKSIVA